MNLELRKLCIEDGIDVYEMLQEIPEVENGFVNWCNGRTFAEYRDWLVNCDNFSMGIGLKDWMVPQSNYWLYVDGIPIGFGKVRHDLTDKLREDGGHIGYSIRPSFRNKGYGKVLLSFLLKMARELNIEKVLLTIRNENTYSLKVAIYNGGVIDKVTSEKHFIWISTDLE